MRKAWILIMMCVALFAHGCGDGATESAETEGPGEETGGEDTESGGEDAGGEETGSEETGGLENCFCSVDADCPQTQTCVDTGAGYACKDYPVVPLCWGDEHCKVGATCEGASPCPCGVACEEEPGVCTEGSGCCNVNEDCSGGDICLEGVCTSTLPGTQCWTDAMCAASQECVGGHLCPCEAQCPVPDAPGKCFPAGGGCCLSDADCPGGGLCVESFCHPVKGAEECWVEADCPGAAQCVGATSCECGATGCSPVPGSCQLIQACCVNDSQCGAGEVCETGACKPVPVEGTCWTAADCDDQICVGASEPCACNVSCAGENPGTCSPLPEGCCATDGECGPEQTCITQHCKSVPQGGDCWVDSDCGQKEECNGASPCPCGEVCAEDSPGTCELLVGCCDSDADCNPGFSCLGDKCHPGLLSPTSCWTDSDCGEDGLCEKANICTCGGPLCIPSAGTCAGGGPIATPGECCDPVDGSCEAGLVCVSGAVCLLVPEMGNCWTDEDCMGGTCLNPSFCGCADDCNVYEPGKCG